MNKKIAFLFSGQGAQYVGMGKELCERYSECENIFDYASQVLGKNMKELCFKGSMQELAITRNTQPALFTVEVATMMVLKKYGIKPDIVAGFSIGEYSALYASGILDLMSSLFLVNQRAAAMDKVSKEGMYGMGAISGENIVEIEKMCKRYDKVWVSNYNSYKQVSITGEKQSVQKVIEEAEMAGYRTAELKVSGAFHCPIMKEAAEEFAASMKMIRFNEASVPIVLNVSGKYYKSTDNLYEIMQRQICSPVLWSNTIEFMLEEGVTDFIEIGPGNVLSKFVNHVKRDKEVNVLHVENMESLSQTINKIYN